MKIVFEVQRLRSGGQCNAQSVLYRSRTLSEWCKRWSLAKTNALSARRTGAGGVDRWRPKRVLPPGHLVDACATWGALRTRGRSTVDEPDRTAHGCPGGYGGAVRAQRPIWCLGVGASPAWVVE